MHSKIDENDEIFDDKSVKVLYNASAYADEKDKNVRAFLEYVSTQEAKDDWTKKLEKRVAEIRAMQSVRSDYVTYQMHIKEWIREGRAEGRLEGITQGAHDARVETARNFLALGVVTQEQIAQATGLPLAEVQSLANSASDC